ncbi:MAG TPA: RNA ligase (ATP) [Candidatus Paceibacterota bacterium]|nr:RNA ligase (ATP) [Candidatus Paceibacterota bacterium]
MARKLASIRLVTDILPHPNADRLEIAQVDGWTVVVGKGQFRRDQVVVFCEIDSMLPAREEFAFLAPSCSTIGDDDKVRYRIKSRKLRGVLSQGLVLPLSVLPEDALVSLGDDVTDVLDIKKYEPKLPDDRSVVGPFPSCVPKTDQERIQNLYMSMLQGGAFHCTEKLDGTSCTVVKLGGKIKICSRNYEIDQNRFGPIVRAVHNSGVLDCIQDGYAIQGEVCGPKIQGNRYKLPDSELFVFGVFDVVSGQHFNPDRLFNYCGANDLTTVPDLGNHVLPGTLAEVLESAEGPSRLNKFVQREGVVWRSRLEQVSFKAISNRFLLG